MSATAIRKRPLTLAKSYYFSGEKSHDYATPLRAMAQWVKRHPDVGVLAVGVWVSENDGVVYVTLTIEDSSL